MQLEQAIEEDRAAEGKRGLKPKTSAPETKETKQSRTDKDARHMVREGKPKGFFYLDHRTVDSKHAIITDHATPAAVHDSVPYLGREISRAPILNPHTTLKSMANRLPVLAEGEIRNVSEQGRYCCRALYADHVALRSEYLPLQREFQAQCRAKGTEFPGRAAKAHCSLAGKGLFRSRCLEILGASCFDYSVMCWISQATAMTWISIMAPP